MLRLSKFKIKSFFFESPSGIYPLEWLRLDVSCQIEAELLHKFLQLQVYNGMKKLSKNCGQFAVTMVSFPHFLFFQ